MYIVQGVEPIWRLYTHWSLRLSVRGEWRGFNRGEWCGFKTTSLASNFYAGIEYIETNWVEIKFVVGGWNDKEVQVPTERMRPKWDLERTMYQVNSNFAQSCKWAPWHFRIQPFKIYKFPEFKWPAGSRSTTKARGRPLLFRQCCFMQDPYQLRILSFDSYGPDKRQTNWGTIG